MCQLGYSLRLGLRSLPFSVEYFLYSISAIGLVVVPRLSTRMGIWRFRFVWGGGPTTTGLETQHEQTAMSAPAHYSVTSVRA